MLKKGFPIIIGSIVIVFSVASLVTRFGYVEKAQSSFENGVHSNNEEIKVIYPNVSENRKEVTQDTLDTKKGNNNKWYI